MSDQTRELTAKEQAQLEMQRESFQALVELMKGRIRARAQRPWWHKLIPFTIEIRRREP